MAEIKKWASILDYAALRQAEMLSRAPGVAGHVALMPDAHVSKGATVGSVFPTYTDTIIPAAVGSDIGCGVIASLTNKTSGDLPDDLTPLVTLFERSIPTGVGRKRGSTDQPRGSHVRSLRAAQWLTEHPLPHPDGLSVEKAQRDLGTLGSGNHFLEVCLDESERVWVVLHSGSRGIGSSIAAKYVRRAQEENIEKLEDRDLAALRGQSFDQYIDMMDWAQCYAYANREFMMDAAMADLASLVVGLQEDMRINCHHNFAALETHFDRKVWLTRKGAIKAAGGDLGIIPGSMGTATHITSGLGNADSYMSSSHGAGRQYSRGVAKEMFTVESLQELMDGKAWNNENASGLVDEHPYAYKPIDQVMEDQRDLTQIVHTLRQIVNYKGM